MAAFAALGARSAAAKSRSVATWAFLGAVLGPIALVILEVAPPGRCWACDAQVVGWGTICQWCGTDVRPDPTLTSRRRLRRLRDNDQARPATTADEPVVTPSVVTASVVSSIYPEPSADPSAEGAVTPDTPVAAATTTAAASTTTTRKRASRSTKSGSATTAGTTGTRRRSSAASPPPPPDPEANGVGPSVDAAPEDRSYHDALGDSRPGPSSSPPTTVPLAATVARGSSARAGPTGEDDPATSTTRTLAGAVFVTGNVPLTPGLRYLLALTDGLFEVRGPVDTDPTAIAFSRPLASLDAVSLNGRLIVNAADPGTDATSMVFINLRGTDADGVVETFGRLRESAAPPP